MLLFPQDTIGSGPGNMDLRITTTLLVPTIKSHASLARLEGRNLIACIAIRALVGVGTTRLRERLPARL